MKTQELKEKILNAKKLGSENIRIAQHYLSAKFSSREQVETFLKNSGFEMEYIKSDPENDFTRNLRTGYYYSMKNVCAYEMSGTILIALFCDEISDKFIVDSSVYAQNSYKDITDMSRENDGR